jgi:hypothetical protein
MKYKKDEKKKIKKEEMKKKKIRKDQILVGFQKKWLKFLMGLELQIQIKIGLQKEILKTEPLETIIGM